MLAYAKLENRLHFCDEIYFLKKIKIYFKSNMNQNIEYSNKFLVNKPTGFFLSFGKVILISIGILLILVACILAAYFGKPNHSNIKSTCISLINETASCDSRRARKFKS